MYLSNYKKKNRYKNIHIILYSYEISKIWKRRIRKKIELRYGEVYRLLRLVVLHINIHILKNMAFNGSSGSGNATNSSSSGNGNGGNQDGPLNKRLCTGKENNEAGANSNRVSI